MCQWGIEQGVGGMAEVLEPGAVDIGQVQLGVEFEYYLTERLHQFAVTSLRADQFLGQALLNLKMNLIAVFIHLASLSLLSAS